MKHTPLSKMLALGAVSAVALSTAFAQTTTRETTTTVPSTTTTVPSTAAGVSTSTTTGSTGVSASTSTSTSSLDGTGTITTYTPGSDFISFRSEASSAPVKYYYTKNTTLVDPSGATVDWSLLRPDLPVRYTYVKEGDRQVISKITVQKPLAEIKKVTETTTSTTTTK